MMTAKLCYHPLCGFSCKKARFYQYFLSYKDKKICATKVINTLSSLALFICKFFFIKRQKISTHITFFFFFLFFNWDSLNARLTNQYGPWSDKKKKKKIKLKKEDCLLKNLKIKGVLDLKLFRSYIRGNHSAGREFQSLAVQGKQLLTPSNT